MDDKIVFKVKWLGYPEASWEQEDRIPGFVRKFYSDDSSRLGSKLPNPRIKHTKKSWWFRYSSSIVGRGGWR